MYTYVYIYFINTNFNVQCGEAFLHCIIIFQTKRKIIINTKIVKVCAVYFFQETFGSRIRKKCAATQRCPFLNRTTSILLFAIFAIKIVYNILLKFNSFGDIQLSKLCCDVIRQINKSHKNIVQNVISESLGH